MYDSFTHQLAGLDLTGLTIKPAPFDPSDFPNEKAVEQTIAAVWSDMFVMFSGTSLEADAEDVAWGFVNLFHRAASRKASQLDRASDEVRALLAAADGSEVHSSKLEEPVERAQAALDYLRAQDHRLASVAIDLKAQAADVPARVKALLDERKALSNEVAQLRRELAMAGGSGQGGGTDAEVVNGINFVAQVLSGVSGKDLPALIDEHKARIGSGAVLLIADAGGKAAVAAGVTEDTKDTVSAVDLVKAAVAELGGKGGGGRADMAQGGGKDVANADDLEGPRARESR